MHLSFLGAAGTVTGSRYLLKAGRRQILIDCGLFQGYKQLRLRNWAPLQFDPRKLDAVILTHAHIDHSGYLPLLCRLGYRGRIFSSQGTFELCRILLPDSAHLQEEDAKFANLHGYSKHKPALPLYTRSDADACLEQFTPMPEDKPFKPAQGLTAELKGVGHLLGACFVRLQHADSSLLLSGDMGRPRDPILRAPAPPPASDYLVIESTYGDRRHPAIDPEAELVGWLEPAIARRAVIVVPTFAVGRAQTMLLHVAHMRRKRLIPDIPVFLDSPMAIDATALYTQLRGDHHLTAHDAAAISRTAILVNTPEQSRALDLREGPMIILSASGMASGGRVLHHLKTFAGDPKNLLLFAGFQAPGTRGAAIIGGATSVRIHGADHAVRAEVGQLQAASSHADADELLAWMRQMPTPPRHTFVTHGEPGASEALRYRIAHELNWPVTVPEYRDTVELEVPSAQ